MYEYHNYEMMVGHEFFMYRLLKHASAYRRSIFQLMPFTGSKID